MAEIEIIPKQENIPAFAPKAILVKHITFYPDMDREYEGDQITEDLISDLLHEAREGTEAYFSLIPSGEEDWLEVVCDGEWMSLAYCVGEEEYESYNAAFAETEELSPLESGGQSPIEKRFAIQDLDAGIQAVEYFIRTGKPYPGMDWAKHL